MRIEKSLVLCAAAGMAAGVLAGPPEADLIGNSAKVMVHIDLESLNTSTFGDWIISQAEADSNNFEEVRQMFPGFTLRAEGGIDSITAYATGLSNDGPKGLVMVIQGNENLKGWDERLAGMLADQGSEPATIGGHSAHVIPMDEETGFLTLLDNGENDYTWVLGLSADALGGALSVIDGRGDSIGDEPRESIESMWGKGTFVIFGTADLTVFEDVKPASAVLSMAEQVWGSFGERGGELEAQLMVHAGENKHIKQMVAVYQGLVAFGTMMGQDNEELSEAMELVQAFKVSEDAGALSLSFEYDVDTIIELIESQNDDDGGVSIEIESDDDADADDDDI